MRRRNRHARLYPMPGRGRHGAYPRATWRETGETLVAIAWGLLLHPFELDHTEGTES